MIFKDWTENKPSKGGRGGNHCMGESIQTTSTCRPRYALERNSFILSGVCLGCWMEQCRGEAVSTDIVWTVPHSVSILKMPVTVHFGFNAHMALLQSHVSKTYAGSYTSYCTQVHQQLS